MHECQLVWLIDYYMYVISTWKSWFCLQRWKGDVTNCFMRMWNSCCKFSSCCLCFCLTWKSIVWRSMFCRLVFSRWFIHQDVRVHSDVHMMWNLLLWRSKMKRSSSYIAWVFFKVNGVSCDKMLQDFGRSTLEQEARD